MKRIGGIENKTRLPSDCSNNPIHKPEQQFQSTRLFRLLMLIHHRVFFCILDDTSFGNSRIQPPLIYMLFSWGNIGINHFCHSLAVPPFPPVFLVLEHSVICLPELQRGKHPLLDHQLAHTVNHYTSNTLC